MKETIKTSRTAGYLEKIFRAVNADWFGGELEEPIITIQSTPRAYGHVTVSKIWKRKGEQRHELNIGVAKWIEAYQFTHPNCESISVKVWLKDEDTAETEAR